MQITALSFCIGYLGDFIKVKELIKFVKINPQFTFAYVTSRRKEGYLMEPIKFLVILFFTNTYAFIVII
jgi:hypothetical protein